MDGSSIIRFNNSSPSYSHTADNNIPHDSTPIISRGGRFVMASRVLPTSSSAFSIRLSKIAPLVMSL